jgi:predicted kinase
MEGRIAFMNKFIMMVGVPGSGKSTHADQIAKKENAVIVSSDAMREELFGNVWELGKNAVLFREMLKRCHQYLSEGRSVIYDATNIRSSERKRIIKKFIPYFKECYYVKTPLEKVLRQNAIRARNVPEDIIRRMYGKIQEPQLTEGWDKINIISEGGRISTN